MLATSAGPPSPQRPDVAHAVPLPITVSIVAVAPSLLMRRTRLSPESAIRKPPVPSEAIATGTFS